MEGRSVMSFQQITIVGRAGNDPSLKYTQSGVAVTDFSLAVNRKWTDSNGERKEHVTWWRVTCWRKTAEIVAQYVKKGRQVMVVASQIEANAYAGNDGEPRASLDVTADQVIFLSGGESQPRQERSYNEENLPF
jgi:single-strand DNA-binding protein